MARSRRHHTPFKAWGTTLSGLTALLGYMHDWAAMAAVGAFLAFYLLFVRLTRCRVETRFQLPCRWLVRGLLGTCNVHTGDKRGLPVLVRADGLFSPPKFMWRRAHGRQLQSVPVSAEPQPVRGSNAVAAKAARPLYDQLMMALTAVGVLIAAVSLLHDVF